ncbi:hypothetical protein KKF84_07535 [Myxococcota bacterium]|nr:hypothetical protein [Myxococcota bacterium]MBU1535156.1 hypothetical protein [Myxococcota bacterium]
MYLRLIVFFSLLPLIFSCSPTSSSNNNINNTNNSGCADGLTTCDGTCVDISTDNLHCGWCNHACQQYASCNGEGACVLSCPIGTEECSGECANLDTDYNHCGDCLTACTGDETCIDGSCDDGTCSASISEADEGVLPADIIVVVDNSGTMGDEAASVQASMHDFVGAVVNSGIDAHVILISADSNEDAGVCVPAPVGSGNCPNDENLPEFRHVMQDVGSSNALELILSTYPQWAPSLRPSATKTILVITDDNSGLNATSFTTQLLALDPTFEGFKFSGIIAPYNIDQADCVLCEFLGTCNTGSCDTCCGTDTILGLLCTALPAEEGTVYRDLITATGGIEGNLCIQDFQPAFNDLATAVIWESQVDCVYNIPEPPEGEVIDYTKINVDYQPTPTDDPQAIYNVPGGIDDCGIGGGWYYDELDPHLQLSLCPTTCTEVSANLQAVITVKFGCATVVQ